MLLDWIAGFNFKLPEKWFQVLFFQIKCKIPYFKRVNVFVKQMIDGLQKHCRFTGSTQTC